MRADSSRPVLGLAQSALLASWLGVAIGLLELPLLALRRFGLGIPVYMTPQVVWGAPLSYVLLFVPIGIVLGLVGRWWRLPGRPAAVVLVLTFFGVYSALQVFRIELYLAASLLLAAGVAWRAAAAASRAPERLRRFVRRTALPLALLVAALAAGVNLLPALRERRALASLGPAPAGVPNVLLLILDTMRAASMSLYGHPRPTTPNLDRLAANAVVFERAVVTSSWSNPSHAGIFTGHFPHNVSSGWERGLDDTHPTLAEVMHAAGFRTAAFSANTRYVSRQTGMARGFARFDDFPVLALDGAIATTWAGRLLTDRRNLVPRALGIRDTPGRKYAPEVLEPLMDWMDDDTDRPFFAVANLMDVHGVYLPPDPHASRFGAVPMPTLGARVLGRLRQLVGGEPARVPDGRDIEGYLASFARLDEHLANFFAELERRGVLDNTVVIVTSDHGEEFHEHGLYGHGVSLYWPAIHVPLIIWLPGGAGAGLRVPSPVSLRALPATIADLARLADAPFPGRSLARAWNGTGITGDTVLSELPHPQATQVRGRRPLPKGPMQSAVLDSLHYIRYADGSEELFDIVTDPGERGNLVDRTDPATLERFRALINAIARRRVDTAAGSRTN
jgi:arylsulfatase A-like enzyme